jgi:hypothetical protein
MKILIAVILISLFTLGSYNFVKDRLVFNDCMDRTKLDYISKKGANHISAICKTYL